MLAKAYPEDEKEVWDMLQCVFHPNKIKKLSSEWRGADTTRPQAAVAALFGPERVTQF